MSRQTFRYFLRSTENASHSSLPDTRRRWRRICFRTTQDWNRDSKLFIWKISISISWWRCGKIKWNERSFPTTKKLLSSFADGSSSWCKRKVLPMDGKFTRRYANNSTFVIKFWEIDIQADLVIRGLFYLRFCTYKIDQKRSDFQSKCVSLFANSVFAVQHCKTYPPQITRHTYIH